MIAKLEMDTKYYVPKQRTNIKNTNDGATINNESIILDQRAAEATVEQSHGWRGLAKFSWPNHRPRIGCCQNRENYLAHVGLPYLTGEQSNH